MYVIINYFCCGWESDLKVRLASTEEKAKEILNKWGLYEERTSWIASYDKDEFDAYEFSEKYFDAQYGELRTTIWIEKVAVDNTNFE